MSSGNSGLVDTCQLCQHVLDSDKLTVLGEKGAQSINTASRERGDAIVVDIGTKVHTTCRRDYTNKFNISRDVKQHNAGECSVRKRSVRVASGPFNSKSDCVLCGTHVLQHDNKFQAGEKTYSSCVKTDSFVTTILDSCDSRFDDWSTTVKARIEYYMRDLHAADCLYHHNCSVNFRTGRDIPLLYQVTPNTKRRKPGRPTNDEREQAFLKTCEYLEDNDEEQLTVCTLCEKLGEFLESSDELPYVTRYMKSKLIERYGNSVDISTESGLIDIVTMREKTDQILRSYFIKAKTGDEESQKKAIIETAAKLLKSDIKSEVKSARDEYPGAKDMKLEQATDYVPSSLRLLLQLLFVGKDIRRKVASIGQAIVQSVRPRSVLAPLQLGLAAQMQYLFRSRFFIDTLNYMGFSSSYGEAQRFEKNAACTAAPEVIGESSNPLGTTLLFAADNVDHNIITLDGKGTFHGMGMIAAMTPGNHESVQIVKRQEMSALNINELTKIDIHDFSNVERIRRSIQFNALPIVQEHDNKIDILWELSFRFHQPSPNWQGMMHIVHQGCEHPGPSSVVFLPMIDLYPGDKTCIYSTLQYLCNLASAHNVPAIVTFDQPLFWKASEIINKLSDNSSLRNIVLLLGSFHTLMNLLGAIGTLMDGSGLSDVMKSIYGENAVVHIMSGKAVQRAFRAHLLVDKCLTRDIVSEVDKLNPEFSSLVDVLEALHTSLLSGKANLETLMDSDCLGKI